MNSAGVACYTASTTAGARLITMYGGLSGFASEVRRDVRQLHLERLLTRSLRQVLHRLEPITLPLGSYEVILEPEADGGYHAFCPALKGCHSQGDTQEEAVANIREAIEAYLESVKAHGEPIPREEILIQPVDVAI